MVQTIKALTITMILARLLSASPQIDGEHWDLQFRLHKDIIHTDPYGQNPAPFQRNPNKSQPNRVPYPWQPNNGTWPATAALNPYYAALNPIVDTTVSPTSIDFYGSTPVSIIATGDAPQVPLQAATSPTGGNILPGTYLFALGASNAGPIAPQFVIAVVPTGTTTNTITISGVIWLSAASATPYVGETSQRMRECDLSDYTTASPDTFGNPTSFTFTAITPMGSQGLPDVIADHFLLIARDIIHGGVWGDAVSSTGSSTLTFAAASWTTNQWAGYRISLYYHASPTFQTAVDYIVASNNANTVTLTTAHSLVAGDVVVMRAAATSITANTIGDANFVNSYAPSGMGVNAHIGAQIQIVSGTGAGQPSATIQSNTATIFTIFGSWATTPDSTSMYIVTSAGYRYLAETASSANTGAPPVRRKVGSIQALNFLGGSLLIEGLTVDAYENYSVERFAPIREIYIPGSTLPPGATNGPLDTIAVVAGTATPNLSFANHYLVITADTFLAAPTNPPTGASAAWILAVDNTDTSDHQLLPDSTYSFSPTISIAAGTRAKIGWLTSQSGNSSLNFISMNQPQTAI